VYDRTKKWSTNFLPEKLVLLGNLALFVWIVLDAVLKTESILAQNNLLNKVKTNTKWVKT
jgi:hypothetical protein